MSELPQPPAYDPDAAYIRGIPYPLPPGERVLWEGGPSFLALVSHVFKVRLFVIYFALLLVAQGLLVGAARGADAAVQVLLPLSIAGSFTCGFFLIFAWLTARNSWYAVTSRRIVLRVGIALTVTINIPLRLIASADLRRFADGTGELAFPLLDSERLSLFQLWPHWRPWGINRPVPQMRALERPQEAAEALRAALEASLAAEAAEAGADAAASREPATAGG